MFLSLICFLPLFSKLFFKFPKEERVLGACVELDLKGGVGLWWDGLRLIPDLGTKEIA